MQREQVTKTDAGTIVASGVLGTCVFVLALAFAATVHAQDAGVEAPAEVATMSVEFDELSIVAKGGRLVVHYTVREDDWEYLQGEERVLWVRLHIPTDGETTSGYPFYTYTLGIDERRGRLEFPRWLSTFGAEQVGICPLATGPGDHLSLGRGWICSDATWSAVRRSQPAVPTEPVSFELRYHSSPRYAPSDEWRGPSIPDFISPFDG